MKRFWLRRDSDTNGGDLPSSDRHRLSTARNASLDVLRCLLMFGVVLQHTFAVCKYGGVVAYSSYIVWDCLTHPSVDGFTAISGWFGVRCTLRKLFRLGCLILFCGTLHWFVYQVGQILCGPYFASRLGLELKDIPFRYECFRYWYLGAYIKLMLLTVILNPAFGLLARMGKLWTAVSLLLVVAGSYLSLLWIPWQSHSPRTVIFIYVVVRLLMMLGLERAMRDSRFFRRSSFCILAGLTSVIVIDALCRKYGVSEWNRLGINSWNYRNPLTVLTGIFVVACFSVLELPQESRLVRLCCKIAPSMISVYMLHWNFMETFFKPLPQMMLSKIPHFPIVASFVICAIAIFLLCTTIDLCRRWVLEKTRPHWPDFLLGITR